jgi:predicted Fe-Mo cluster-binding NifX family protein
MKLCIPVRFPAGLESCIEPHLPNAEHLLFFDTGTREIRHIDLREYRGEAPQFDVVLCTSVDRATRDALTEKEILAAGTAARTAGEAIAEFETRDRHAGDEHGQGVKGSGHHEAHAVISRKMLADALKIAVSSQDRRTITGHTGRCRRFWVYEIRGNRVDGKALRELTPAQTLHSSPLGNGHPLDDVHVLITAAVSPFLYQRLQRGGVKPFVTEESDPDEAVRMLLEKVAGSGGRRQETEN